MPKSNTSYLTIEVNWRGRCGPEAVKQRLQDSATHLLEEGLLTPDHNCELVAWKSWVHEDALPTPAAAQLLPEMIRALELTSSPA